MARVDFFGPIPPKPRAKPLKRMRVNDAGNGPDGRGCIQFICPHCGHDTDWIEDEWSVSEAQRGLPCPICNEGAG